MDKFRVLAGWHETFRLCFQMELAPYIAAVFVIAVLTVRAMVAEFNVGNEMEFDND